MFRFLIIKNPLLNIYNTFTETNFLNYLPSLLSYNIILITFIKNN